ncbi:ArnT family glycosyltransferase [Desulfosoma caldarium]|uniref:4-amino-4-deoxy-L-arabinose transferase-like glycosyltransferase n=1 Tax=Desulfosoma caldarium TaxID=610254 RepID=A0A3N1USE9_9BACT|nr:glycosyltransferase family 39 protein [Desulfosoma caldarium]ROQ90771.1 4-amino-4-deoxy-L-arabinose transferase-like glycosyltransferase [Desulfosoma caldarium]
MMQKNFLFETIPQGWTWDRLRGHLKDMRFVLILAGVFLLLAGAVYPQDHEIMEWLRSGSLMEKHKPLSQWVKLIKPFGKGDVLACLALVMGVCGLRRRAVAILMSLIVVFVLVWPLKIIVARERPREASHVSFPSGDAASAAAFAVPVVVEAPALLPVAAGVVGAVGAARVLEDAHYTSDVLAGISLGLVAGMAGLFFVKGMRVRLRRHQFAVGALILVVEGLLPVLMGKRGKEFMTFAMFYGPAVLLAAAAHYLRIESRRQFLVSALTERLGERKLVALTSAVFIMLIVALFLFTTSRSTLWDRDEPRFARATMEMVESGNYLIPTFNGALRPDKPILIYWLMSLSVRLFGPTSVACRFFSPLGTALTCLMTLLIGRRFFDSKTGLLAAMVVATTPLVLMTGTAATTDAVLVGFMMVALAAFARALETEPRWRWILVMAAALAAAQLTKGPVGLAVPLVSMITVLVLSRRETARLRQFVGPLLLVVGVSTAVFLLWALPANKATNGEFLRLGIGHHVVERSINPLEHHGGRFLFALPFYLPVVVLGFFPWTLFLPQALSKLMRGQLGGTKVRAFLVGCIFPTFVLMSLVATKLPHYVLPIWPALALVVAATLAKGKRALQDPNYKVYQLCGRLVFSILGLALGATLMIAPWFVPLQDARGSIFSLGLLFLVMTILTVREHRYHRYGTAASILVLGMLLFQTSLSVYLLPSLESMKVSPPIAHAINEHTPRDVQVATYKYGEPSLNFYLDRYILPLKTGTELVSWAQQPVPGVLVIPRKELEKIENQYGGLGLTPFAVAKGYNYSKGKWVELLALKRSARPLPLSEM